MPRGDKPTTTALALKDGWVYEDTLPQNISQVDYDWWFKESLVLDGVRMGPPLTTKPESASPDSVESSNFNAQCEYPGCPLPCYKHTHVTHSDNSVSTEKADSVSTPAETEADSSQGEKCPNCDEAVAILYEHLGMTLAHRPGDWKCVMKEWPVDSSQSGGERELLPEQGITEEKMMEMATPTERAMLEWLKVSCPSAIFTNRDRLRVAREFATRTSAPADMKRLAEQCAEKVGEEFELGYLQKMTAAAVIESVLTGLEKKEEENNESE
jgi:hypothetical protein